jgi:predicted PurR-regulated permease PerM
MPAPLKALAYLVLVLAAALLLREVASLIVPLLFGAFLALVSWPLVDRLSRRGVHPSIALAVTVLIVLVAVLGSLAVIALSVGQLVVLVPRYEEQLTALIASTQAFLEGFGIPSDPRALLSVIPPEQVANVIRSVASGVSSAGLAILVLMLTMAYALAGAASSKARAEKAFGIDHPLLAGVQDFAADLRRYLLVRAELGIFAAVLVFLLLFVLGVPLPALWAFLVFAASFIPNIGVIVAVIPPTILALLDSGLGAAILVVVGYTVINLAQDNLLQPLALGAELNLSPLVVFVSVVVWAWILGAAGALLAVPLTVALVAILEAAPTTRSVAALMRSRADEPAGLSGPDGAGPDGAGPA